MDGLVGLLDKQTERKDSGFVSEVEMDGSVDHR